MPRFAANLSMLYNDVDFLDRFAAAARDGFKAVEYLFPYAYPAQELAARLQPPSAPRAVGGAVGRNPLAVLVPCHRVLGTGGALTGYASGLPLKRQLLQHEGRWLL